MARGCSGGGSRAWSPDAQEAARLLAVSALVEGRDRVEVAALFKVSVKAVDNWWAKWQAGGGAPANACFDRRHLSTTQFRSHHCSLG
ncbi:helix-turn-helix domain-containing protein [Streptomyces microflavus]|uniref:helix-turn-helix domain-containing protein n=1 Tax=Streptomyces microflavus TaxID=1919 RepID=UPI00380A0824